MENSSSMNALLTDSVNHFFHLQRCCFTPGLSEAAQRLKRPRPGRAGRDESACGGTAARP